MLSLRTPLAFAALLITLTAASKGLTGCGREAKNLTKDVPPDESSTSDQRIGSGAAVTLDGKKVTFFQLGETVAYEGKLTEEDGTRQFHDGRAFTLTTAEVLHLTDSEATSPDCNAPDDYVGPNYTIIKMPADPAAEPEIVRSTEGLESNGNGSKGSIPATDLADFPGQLDAGTYVVAVDYLSVGKACSVKGSFTLGS